MKYMNFRTISGRNGFSYYDEENGQYVFSILNDIYTFFEKDIRSVTISQGYSIPYALSGCFLLASAIPFAFNAKNSLALLIPAVLLTLFGINMFFSGIHDRVTIIEKYNPYPAEESEEKTSQTSFCLHSLNHKKNMDLYHFLQQHLNSSEIHILENDNAETSQEESL